MINKRWGAATIWSKTALYLMPTQEKPTIIVTNLEAVWNFSTFKLSFWIHDASCSIHLVLQKITNRRLNIKNWLYIQIKWSPVRLRCLTIRKRCKSKNIRIASGQSALWIFKKCKCSWANAESEINQMNIWKQWLIRIRIKLNF